MASRRVTVMFSGLLMAALSLGSAPADDLSSMGIETAPSAPVIAPGPTTYLNFLDEARFGVYAHNETGLEAVRTLAYSIPAELQGHLDLVHPTVTSVPPPSV